MRPVYLAVAALLGVAIAVQVVYARSYAPNATRAARIVWAANVALLAVLLAAFVWLALTPGVSASG